MNTPVFFDKARDSSDTAFATTFAFHHSDTTSHLFNKIQITVPSHSVTRVYFLLLSVLCLVHLPICWTMIFFWLVRIVLHSRAVSIMPTINHWARLFGSAPGSAPSCAHHRSIRLLFSFSSHRPIIMGIVDENLPFFCPTARYHYAQCHRPRAAVRTTL